MKEQICCHQSSVRGELLDLPCHWETVGSERFPEAPRVEIRCVACKGSAQSWCLLQEEKEDCCERRNWVLESARSAQEAMFS